MFAIDQTVYTCFSNEVQPFKVVSHGASDFGDFMTYIEYTITDLNGLDEHVVSQFELFDNPFDAALATLSPEDRDSLTGQEMRQAVIRGKMRSVKAA